jgi:hypothetical protein
MATNTNFPEYRAAHHVVHLINFSKVARQQGVETDAEYEKMAKLLRRQARLQRCARFSFFASLTLQTNLIMLEDMKDNKVLYDSCKVVVRLQQKVSDCAETMTRAYEWQQWLEQERLA